MLEKLREYDVVIGSRYVEGGQDLRHPIRVYASKLINGFAELVLNHGIKDYDSGFVLLRRSVLDKVLPIPIGYGEYFIEFVYACCRKGLKVCEVPYAFKDRVMGASKSFPSLWRFLVLGSKYILRILQARLRRID
jgi:dolichol-phosphate mannosyltransferase